MAGEIEILSKKELQQLCGATHTRKQREALKAMGIPFITRPNGCPVVERSHARKMLGNSAANDEGMTIKWSGAKHG